MSTDSQVPAEAQPNEAALAEGLSNAIASQEQIASAPSLQDVSVVDSNAAGENLQSAPSWRERLGWQDFDGLEDDAAIERLKGIRQAGAQAYQQSQYYAQQLQEAQSRLQAYEAAKHVAAQPQVPAKPEPAKKPWEPVAFNEEWLGYIDPATRTWRENTPYNVVAAYEKYQRAQNDFINKMYTKPDETLAPYITEQAKSVVTPLQQKLEAIEARLAQQQQQQEIQGFLSPYVNQLYVVDQTTGQVQRDQFGNPVQTSTGQSFNQFANAIQQSGVTDPKQIALMALMAAQNAEMKAQLAQAPVAAQTQQTARQQHDNAIYQNGHKPANGVNRIANRGNTVNASQAVTAPVQNGHTSMEDLFRQGLREQFPNGIANS